MSTASSYSTFIRPPGSPVYGPSGTSLVLPRRVRTNVEKRSPGMFAREDSTVDARRQILDLLALLREAGVSGDTTSGRTDQNEELARSLQKLEAELAERENAVEEREFKIAERERDLAEAEVLVKHHQALLVAARRTSVARPGLSEEEQVALRGLKAELDRQEAVLRESKEALREREKFIEDSERCLFDKVQQQQEKETELEQREEEIRAREAEAGLGEKKSPDAKPAFDEFNE